MTRKDYELLAAVLKRYADADNTNEEHLKSAGLETPHADRARSSRTRLIIRDIADALASDNARFNPETFYKSAGI